MYTGIFRTVAEGERVLCQVLAKIHNIPELEVLTWIRAFTISHDTPSFILHVKHNPRKEIVVDVSFLPIKSDDPIYKPLKIIVTDRFAYLFFSATFSTDGVVSFDCTEKVDKYLHWTS
jgi:hypothetical protein